MIHKNSDVERALAAFGAENFTYHSFGPFSVRARQTIRVEPPVAVTHEPLESPAAPVVQVVAAPQPVQPPPVFQSAPIQAPMPMPQPLDVPPPVQPPPPVPEARPVMMSPPVVIMSPPPAPPPSPTPFATPVPPAHAPRPAPFFQLLASALPASSASAAPPSAYARSPVPAQAPAATMAPPTAPVPAVPASDAERRSLDAMFRVLAPRGDSQGEPAAPDPAPAGGAASPQSLFRRI